MAAWYNYRGICHTLVEAGASLTRLDYQNNTPDHDDKARQNGDKELARYLIGEFMTAQICYYVYVFRSRTLTAYLQEWHKNYSYLTALDIYVCT